MDEDKKTFFEKAKTTMGKINNTIKNKIEDAETKRNIKKLFESKCTTFSIFNLSTKLFKDDIIKVIFSIEDKTFLFLTDDKNKDYIKANVILLNLSDNSKIIIKQVDCCNVVPYTFDYGNEQKSLDCYKAYYELYNEPEKPIQQVTYNNSNSVTILGNNSGDINQINDVNTKLSEIENAINANKKISRKQKIEISNYYGNFKNCVINKTPDKNTFDKFIELLKVIAPNVIPIATTLFSQI